MDQEESKGVNRFEKDLELDLRDIYGLIKRNLKLITYIVTGILLYSSIKIYSAKDNWEGSFDIVIEESKADITPGLSSALLSQGGLGKITNALSSSDKLKTQIEILKSPSVLLPIYEFVKKEKSNLNGKLFSWSYINWSKNSLKIKLIEGTSVLNLKYKDTDKDLVIPVLNKISKVYQEYSNNKKSKSLDGTIKYLTEQISIYEEKTKNSLKDLEIYANKHDIVLDINTSAGAAGSFPSNISNLIPDARGIGSFSDFNAMSAQVFKSEDIELARIEATNNIKKIESLKKQISSIDENSGEFIYILKNLESLSPGLKREILILDSQLAKLKAVYKEEDSTIKFYKQQLHNLRKLSKKKLIDYLEASKKTQLSIQESLRRPMEVLLKYKELLFETTQNDETLRQLKNQMAISMLKREENSQPWNLITSPTVLPKPVGPPRTLYMLYAILGSTISGLLISFLKEKKDNLIFKSDFLKNELNIENLYELSFKKIENFDLSISIICNNIKSNQEIKSIEIIPTGKVKKEVQNYILKKFKENIVESEIKDLSKIKYNNKSYGKIFLSESGTITKNELKEISKVIKLFNSKFLLFIFIKD